MPASGVGKRGDARKLREEQPSMTGDPVALNDWYPVADAVAPVAPVDAPDPDILSPAGHLVI